MDKVQPFIRDYLLSRGEKDVASIEDRLNESLIISATKKRTKKPRKLKSLLHVSHGSSKHSLKQTSYKSVNANSKAILRSYVLSSKHAVERATRLINKKEAEGSITTLSKEEKYQYLKENYPDIYRQLPKKFTDVQETLYKKMWLPYIREVLKISDVESLQCTNLQNCLLKLSIADYNGCLLKVSTSRNTSTLNTSGIVLWDAQKSFIMLSPKKDGFDEVKVIPKKGTLFEISIPLETSNGTGDSAIFNIVGDRFQYRSSDRSGRKFKNRRVDDLLFYLSSEATSSSS